MTTIIEVLPQDTARLNHAAALLNDYFLYHAHGDIEQVCLHDWKRLSDIIDNTSKSRHRIFLAYPEDSSLPVGVAGINRRGCAEHLYVSPAYRGNGVARKLVAAQFDNGAWFTTVNENNTASLSLIRGTGLRELEKRYNGLVMFIHDDIVEELEDSQEV